MFLFRTLYNGKTIIEDNTSASDQKPHKAQTVYLLTRPPVGCPSNYSSISGIHNSFISSSTIHTHWRAYSVPHSIYTRGFSESSKVARVRSANINNQWNCNSTPSYAFMICSHHYLSELYNVTCTLYNFRVITQLFDTEKISHCQHTWLNGLLANRGWEKWRWKKLRY